jgi:hypothetical protein
MDGAISNKSFQVGMHLTNFSKGFGFRNFQIKDGKNGEFNL